MQSISFFGLILGGNVLKTLQGLAVLDVLDSGLQTKKILAFLSNGIYVRVASFQLTWTRMFTCSVRDLCKPSFSHETMEHPKIRIGRSCQDISWPQTPKRVLYQEAKFHLKTQLIEEVFENLSSGVCKELRSTDWLVVLDWFQLESNSVCDRVSLFACDGNLVRVLSPNRVCRQIICALQICWIAPHQSESGSRPSFWSKSSPPKINSPFPGLVNGSADFMVGVTLISRSTGHLLQRAVPPPHAQLLVW